MADLVIYGFSDDLIEIEGVVSDELEPPYGKAAVVTIRVDDARYATLLAEYDRDGDGQWRVVNDEVTDAAVVIVPARGEDEPDDEDGCPGYSDKAVIDMGGIESRRINVSAKAVV